MIKYNFQDTDLMEWLKIHRLGIKIRGIKHIKKKL